MLPVIIPQSALFPFSRYGNVRSSLLPFYSTDRRADQRAVGLFIISLDAPAARKRKTKLFLFMFLHSSASPKPCIYTSCDIFIVKQLLLRDHVVLHFDCGSWNGVGGVLANNQRGIFVGGGILFVRVFFSRDGADWKPTTAPKGKRTSVGRLVTIYR